MSFSSAQKTELQVVIWALQDNSSSVINLFSDSTYVYGVMPHNEISTIHTSQEYFFH